VAVAERAGEKTQWRIAEKHVETHLFVVGICRVAVPFPVSCVRIYLDGSALWFLSVYADCCIDKIRARHAVPHAKLNNTDGFAVGPDEIAAKLTGKPPCLKFQLASRGSRPAYAIHFLGAQPPHALASERSVLLRGNGGRRSRRLRNEKCSVSGMPPKFVRTALVWLCVVFSMLMQPLQGAIREIATISTSLGDMEFELFSDVSPRAVANFKYLADTRFYDGTAFHRLIERFMIQGGDPYTRGTTAAAYSPLSAYAGGGGPEYTIPNEPTTREDRAHVRGVLSMAKTEAPDSGGSQFFIMFGSAPWLDNVHAPMGQIISGASVLSAIEPKVTDAKDKPQSPILINTIRVRAERTVETPVSRMRFQSGTYAGLLRKVDRNQDACGSYQLTVTSGGAFSAQIQYYGRRNYFTGALRQSSTATPEASYVGTLDASAAVPLRVRLVARETSASGISVALRVGGQKSDGSDLEDSTLSVAACELSMPSSLAERYTAAFESPLVMTGTSSSGEPIIAPRFPELTAAGYVVANVRPQTGLVLLSGRLQDNSAFSLARPVSNEGGRLSVAAYYHDLQAATESKRSTFSSVPLSDWSGGGFTFGIFRFRLVAALELPPKLSLPQPSNVSGSYLIWYREPKSSGPLANQIVAGFPVTTAVWTPPKAGQPMSPFTSDGSPALVSAGSTVGSFRVARSNAAGVFEPAASAPQLRFNPMDGTFQGSFFDNSSGSRIRRTFQGVLLQKEGSNKGSGFSLSGSASVPVSLEP
jgi:peptidyl-prolyl cis-trans isomerase B (cyclophilin B)